MKAFFQLLSSFWQRLTSKMNPPVFFGSAFLVIAFCIYGSFATLHAEQSFKSIEDSIVRNFGWYYALIVTCFVIFTFWMLIGKTSKVKLGPPDSKPEFSRLAWFTMLFSAGMGTGMVFWGVAEPLYHYANPLFGEAQTPESARSAMRYTFFHWGLHPWAIYVIFAVAIGYFHFRRELPLAPRSILSPLIGRHIHGPVGHFVDILCTVGTLLGVSTSLGLGAMQINSGTSAYFPSVENTVFTQITIIAIITLVATISVVSGIHKGIRRLSMLNIFLASLLMIFVFIAGPTVAIMETFVGTMGQYVQNLPMMSLWVDYSRDNDWQANWTLFYWGWWISWSPFVGIFVARISYGRTIREFIFTVLIVPTLGTFFWLSVFGGTALQIELSGQGGLLDAVQKDVSISLHALLEHLPLSKVTMLWGTMVVIVFFITSSDSGSLVDDMVTSGGHPNPAKPQRVFWAVSEGTVAAVLLYVGGLKAIQHASISMGFLMSFLLIAICFSLTKALREDAKKPENVPKT